MNYEIEESWMQPVWTQMFQHLPASILVNLGSEYYCVRDNSLKSIFDWDIDADGFDDLIRGLAAELQPSCRADFIETLSYERVNREWKNGRHGYSLLSDLPDSKGKKLRTDVLFGQRTNEVIVEFRFDLVDIRYMLPERLYMAGEC